MVAPSANTSNSPSELPTISRRLKSLYVNKLAVALFIAVFLLIYFTNAFRAIDYPEYDETYYLRRGIAVLDGQIADANIGNIRNSPVMVLYYALWYKIIGSGEVYRWVFVSGLWLMTYALYLLMLRTASPLVSGTFALFTLVATTPLAFQNMRFTVGIALLWFSLYLLGGKIISRMFGVLAMILASFVRPEFLSALLIVVLGLAYYEWRQIRKRPRLRTYTLAAYVPVVLMLIFIIVRLWQLSGYQEPRVVRTIPFSYTIYIVEAQPDRLDRNKTGSDQRVFYDDFGLSTQASLSDELVAMLQQPGKSVPYIFYNIANLFKGLGGSVFDEPRWSYENQNLVLDSLSVPLKFWIVALAFAAVLGLAYHSARTYKIKLVPALNTPLVLGYLGLATLIPWMLLANAVPRTFMLFPLLVLPLGYALTILAQRIKTPIWLPAALIVLLLIVFPRPFTRYVDSRVIDSQAFIRQHIPAYSTVFGLPVESYANSLYADGFTYIPAEGSNYRDPALVHAYQTDPSIRYVLCNDVYIGSACEQWLAEWKAVYPDRAWVLVAQAPSLKLRLYELEDSDRSVF
jgi:hypothetical protein